MTYYKGMDVDINKIIAYKTNDKLVYIGQTNTITNVDNSYLTT